MLFGHHHRDGHYNINVRGLGSDFTAVIVAFLAVVCGVMAFCVWLLDAYLTMGQMIGIAFVLGLVLVGIFGVRMAIRNEKKALDAARDQRENKAVETQKQIDAMLRGNSNIPTVKK